MMNEMKYRRSTLLALLLLCLSILLAVPKAADAAGIENDRVIDEMNLLSDAEVQKLDAQLAAVERAHHVRVLAAVVGNWKDKPLKPLADNIIKTIAPGGENGAVLLLLSPENRNYYVATDAKMSTRITDEGIEHLTDQFVAPMKDKKYAEGFTVFGTAVDEMLTYYEKEGKPFTTGGVLSAVARVVAGGGAQAKDAAGLGPVRVVDESDLITDAEEQALDAKLAAYEAAHGIRVLVGTVKNTHGQVLGKVANGVVDRIADGGANGTIVLLLAPKERDFYISTDNKMRERITDDDGISYLADQFVPSLKEDKYAEGFTAFAAAVDEMATYYEKEGKPFNPNAFLFTIITLVGALIAAALVYWFIFANLSDSMLSVRSAHEADDYVERGSFRLTHRADIFLRTTESRETKYKATSSSSSSGSYISTSSRDSSHGGGGGKY